MAKKKSRKVSRKNDAFERRMEDFGDEMGEIGERFGRRMERHGRRWERRGEECDTWFRNTFGLVGPLISGVLGIIILSLVIWLINFLNSKIGSWFLAEISLFLITNIGLFFLIFLFFSYTSYFSKFHRRTYVIFSPIPVAVGAAVCMWIAASAINTVNIQLGNPLLAAFALNLNENLFWVSWLFLCIGYLVLAVILATKGHYKPEEGAERMTRTKSYHKKEEAGIRRLYRSGKDRILGGVCGGIAEYLGVDPVIIRLLWVVGSLAWGFGILLYIICWIIIPRNPNHKWK